MKNNQRKSGRRSTPATVHVAVPMLISQLKPHAKNYRKHPPDELRHLVASIERHGLYRNVVAARDGTVLAGHGVVEAAKAAGHDRVPVVTLDLDPNEDRAVKVLVGDNEIGRMAESDDRQLTDLLREVSLGDPANLLGTGFDAVTLANLALTTRPWAELATEADARKWAGDKDATPEEKGYPLIISFRNDEDIRAFAAKTGLDPVGGARIVRWNPPSGGHG